MARKNYTTNLTEFLLRKISAQTAEAAAAAVIVPNVWITRMRTIYLMVPKGRGTVQKTRTAYFYP